MLRRPGPGPSTPRLVLNHPTFFSTVAEIERALEDHDSVHDSVHLSGDAKETKALVILLANMSGYQLTTVSQWEKCVDVKSTVTLVIADAHGFLRPGNADDFPLVFSQTGVRPKVVFVTDCCSLTDLHHDEPIELDLGHRLWARPKDRGAIPAAVGFAQLYERDPFPDVIQQISTNVLEETWIGDVQNMAAHTYLFHNI
jgi:hypothetical protein